MDARKNLTANSPADRFHHLKQLISFPTIGEVVFLFQICRLKEPQRTKDGPTANKSKEVAAASGAISK